MYILIEAIILITLQIRFMCNDYDIISNNTWCAFKIMNVQEVECIMILGHVQ